MRENQQMQDVSCEASVIEQLYQPGRIYIAGPMRGIQYFNFPAFDAAAAKLASERWEVINPAELDRSIGFDPHTLPSDYDWNDLNACEFSLYDAVDRDVAALKKCDAIYMLDGWQKSRGAKAEKAMAEWLGLEVLYQSPPVEGVLEEALRITSGDRQAQYGPPDQDFHRTAGMWTSMLSHKLKDGEQFETWEVAQMMICLKLSRLQHSRKRDSVVDAAGYARCMDVCYRAQEAYQG